MGQYYDVGTGIMIDDGLGLDFAVPCTVTYIVTVIAGMRGVLSLFTNCTEK